MTKRRRGRKARVDGRSEGAQRFAMVMFEMIKRPVFRTMSGYAKGILFEVWSRFDGKNNGTLSFSVREAKTLLGIGQGTAQRALDDLQVRGFMVRTSNGHWYGRKAATWRLTMITNQGGEPPNFDYRRWQPGGDLRPPAPEPEGEADAALAEARAR